MSFKKGNHSSQMKSISGERTSEEDHTWLLHPGTQNSPGLQEFKHISAIKQCRFTKTELEMDRKIKENKGKLQKKLQKLEEKLKQNNLREPADTLEGKRAEMRSKQPELQGREPASQDGKEVQYLQLQRKKDKTPKITFQVQKLVDELHPQRRESAERLIRAKEKDEDSGENKSPALPNCAGKDEPVDDKQKRRMSPKEETEEPLLPALWSPQARITDEIPNDFQLLPCSVCSRSFESRRLEAHVRICSRVSSSRRPVYDGKRHRTKGTELEQFLKSHRGAEATKVGPPD